VEAAGVRVLLGSERWGDRDVLGPVAASPPPGLDEIVTFDDPAPSGLRSLADLMELGRARPRTAAAVVEGRPDPDVLDILSATSGTTQGVTKLVARTQNQYYSLERQIMGRHGILQDDVLLGLAPITQAIGSNPIYANLLYGSSFIELERFDAAHALDLIAREGVTYIVSVPTHLVDLLDEVRGGVHDLSSLRVVYCAGAAIAPEVAKAVEEVTGAVFLSAYGAIDAGAGSGSAPEDPPAARFTSAGRPFPEDEVRVTDDEGRLVKPGEVGEFRLRGPSSALGYYGDEEADAALFDEEGFARTGDLGFIDGDGYLHVVDRSKDVIIRGGQNIVPAEVERALLTHPSVRHAAVVAAPDARLGEVCCAFVVPRGEAPTLEDLRTHLRQAGLASVKLPERLEIIDALPLSAGGKVRKGDLRQLLRGG
jgi:non-ribosomal peptide synthetase component E (peptide arylation enzyme)